MEDDVLVIERASLEPKYATNFEKPWLVQFESGVIREFDTETDACEFQRSHRLQNNLDLITGEPR